ncbi:MAG: glycosyltransferase family 2 protein [Armatimonadota bacterium]|nr:glycosyltransferase family 2 protein [Armatimonadota bacterium]
MKVSVIVPTYNEENYIGECLKTLMSQTHPDYEVIVVDDGSKDRTVDVASGFGIKVIHQDHKGPGLARNMGAEQSSGEILSFLDADMSFEPDFLVRLTLPIEEGRAVGASSKDELVANNANVWARCWTINAGLPPGRRHPDNLPPEDDVFRAIRRSAFFSVGGYDDIGCSQDRTISRKLGSKALFAEGAICYHRNPASLGEVFRDARWYGKGDQVTRTFGYIIRRTLPFSIKNGVKRAIKHRTWQCLPFQLVYDIGILWGMAARTLSRGNHVK